MAHDRYGYFVGASTEFLDGVEVSVGRSRVNVGEQSWALRNIASVRRLEDGRDGPQELLWLLLPGGLGLVAGVIACLGCGLILAIAAPGLRPVERVVYALLGTFLLPLGAGVGFLACRAYKPPQTKYVNFYGALLVDNSGRQYELWFRQRGPAEKLYQDVLEAIDARG